MAKIRKVRRKPKVLIHDFKHKKHDYLKWWRVVRFWALKKYDISLQDLELLLFLYSEDIFTRKEFLNYCRILQWDKSRLNRMIDEGYVILWRDHIGYKKKAKLYTLSLKSKRICNSVYKKLLQEEAFPVNKWNNPVYMKSSYANRQYRRIMEMMNQRKAENDR